MKMLALKRFECGLDIRFSDGQVLRDARPRHSHVRAFKATTIPLVQLRNWDPLPRGDVFVERRSNIAREVPQLPGGPDQLRQAVFFGPRRNRCKLVNVQLLAVRSHARFPALEHPYAAEVLKNQEKSDQSNERTEADQQLFTRACQQARVTAQRRTNKQRPSIRRVYDSAAGLATAPGGVATGLAGLGMEPVGV